MGAPLNDASFFVIPSASSGGAQTVIAQFQSQQTTLNLAAGASIDFDFATDVAPIFDMFVRTDQVLLVRVFVRQSAADSYAQLGNDYNVAALNGLAIPGAAQPLFALRLPGSQVRIRLLNNGLVATTALSAQVHARSL